MPELPEVETVRKGLERLVVNQEIASITIKVPKMVKTDLNDFMISLPGTNNSTGIETREVSSF